MVNEYATQADLEEYLLGAGKNQVVQQGNFDVALEAASRMIDDYTGRFFYSVAASAKRYTATPDPYSFAVADISTTAGLLVKTDEDQDGVYETTWVEDSLTGAGFWLSPENGPPGYPWTRIDAISTAFPTWRYAIEVTAAWGWGAVPPAIKSATLLQSARLWKRKDAVLGVGGAADTGFFELRRRMDPDVRRLVDPYRRFD